MRNLLLESLPSSLEIGGRKYRIDTDFRTWLTLNEALLNKAGQRVIMHHIIKLFRDDIPSDVDALIAAVGWFLQCGEEVKDEKRRSKRIFSYSYDSDYIISAFQEFYSIDLMRTRYMHWWKFNLLLGTISYNCELKESIRYRSINVIKIKDPAERRRIRKIQAQIALPRDEPLSDEEIASVF